MLRIVFGFLFQVRNLSLAKRSFRWRNADGTKPPALAIDGNVGLVFFLQIYFKAKPDRSIPGGGAPPRKVRNCSDDCARFDWIRVDLPLIILNRRWILHPLRGFPRTRGNSNFADSSPSPVPLKKKLEWNKNESHDKGQKNDTIKWNKRHAVLSLSCRWGFCRAWPVFFYEGSPNVSGVLRVFFSRDSWSFILLDFVAFLSRTAGKRRRQVVPNGGIQRRLETWRVEKSPMGHSFSITVFRWCCFNIHFIFMSR